MVVERNIDNTTSEAHNKAQQRKENWEHSPVEDQSGILEVDYVAVPSRQADHPCQESAQKHPGLRALIRELDERLSAVPEVTAAKLHLHLSPEWTLGEICHGILTFECTETEDEDGRVAKWIYNGLIAFFHGHEMTGVGETPRLPADPDYDGSGGNEHSRQTQRIKVRIGKNFHISHH